MRSVLLRSTELTEQLGLEGYIRSEPTEIVIPVFVFDLRGHELVLLDRHHTVSRAGMFIYSILFLKLYIFISL